MLRLVEVVATTSNLASSSDEALRESLKEICSALGWPVGHAFVLDAPAGSWRDRGVWFLADPVRFAAFRAHTESLTFRTHEGLPGRVLSTGNPYWASEVTHEGSVRRLEQLVELGFRSAMAFPVKVRDEIVAVLEFFSPEVTQPDDFVLDVMGHIGVQLGRVFERERAAGAFQELVEELPVAIYRAEAGALGPWTYVTSRVEQLLGVDPEELMADPKVWLDCIHPDDRERVIAEEDAAVEGEGPYLSEYRVVRPNGETVWIQDEAMVFVDDEGRCCLQGVLLDISERKKAEEEKRQQQERFQALVQNSQDAIALLDGAGIFKYVSPAITKLTGFRPDELLGRSAFELAPPEERDEATASFRQMIEAGLPFEEIEVESKHRDGTSIWIEIHAVNRLDDPAVEGVVLNYHDITERKTHERLQSDLRQAQKMEAVGRLAGGIAHDFNNILAVIGNYAGFLHEDLGKDDPRLPDVVEIEKAVDRAAGMIRQLLAFSRKEITRPEVLDLNHVIADLEKILQRSMGEDVEFRFNPGNELWTVEADRGQIEQILMNLVVNARDAMKLGGRLSIETSNVFVDDALTAVHEGLKPGPSVRIDVSDTGSGMSESIRNQIFEPFFTTKEPGEGTGLGLSTVYGIVKQTNGYISVYSERGVGTTFRIYLPVSTGSPTYPEQTQLRRSTFGPGVRVLVVEDDASVRSVVERILARARFEILIAPSGQEAIELVRRDRKRIDIVLTDVIMPGMSGKDLAEELRVLHPDLRVLFMSGYTGDIIAKRGILDADAELIQKPFTSAELLERLETILVEAV
jgi:PAS domain S-box-containing protein